MEDNLDLINESDKNNKKDLKKNALEDNNEKNQPNIINKYPRDNNLETNKQNTNEDVSNKINNDKVVDATPKDQQIKPKKDIPIEKKPFNEFINDHLLPSLIQEFQGRGLEIKNINLKNTSRPIAGDKCWVIYCEIKDICNFWLSFEKDDISSLKSISLCKSNQKPSVIESFLIDEKRITLKLIISRILQRLNGQKLIGIN